MVFRLAAVLASSSTYPRSSARNVVQVQREELDQAVDEESGFERRFFERFEVVHELPGWLVRVTVRLVLEYARLRAGVEACGWAILDQRGFDRCEQASEIRRGRQAFEAGVSAGAASHGTSRFRNVPLAERQPAHERPKPRVFVDRRRTTRFASCPFRADEIVSVGERDDRLMVRQIRQAGSLERHHVGRHHTERRAQPIDPEPVNSSAALRV